MNLLSTANKVKDDTIKSVIKQHVFINNLLKDSLCILPEMLTLIQGRTKVFKSRRWHQGSKSLNMASCNPSKIEFNSTPFKNGRKSGRVYNQLTHYFCSHHLYNLRILSIKNGNFFNLIPLLSPVFYLSYLLSKILTLIKSLTSWYFKYVFPHYNDKCKAK